MSFFELIIIGAVLSLDAFAVSVCKGLSLDRVKLTDATVCGGWFGIFQGLMLFFGCITGSLFENTVSKIDHWIAFLLLGFIGLDMIFGALGKNEPQEKVLTADGKGVGKSTKNSSKSNSSLSFFPMLSAAVATSIDAFAVGISFGIIAEVNIGLLSLAVAAITFILCFLGAKLGGFFGSFGRRYASLVGGSILILLAFKVLFEHLGVLSFL